MDNINELQVELDTCKARQAALEKALAKELDSQQAKDAKILSDVEFKAKYEQEKANVVFDNLARLEAAQEKDLAEAKLKSLEKIANDRLDKKRLNAHEARQIANTTTVPFVHVYKLIRDCAQEGLSKIEWSTQDWSDTCKERLIKELELDGYTLNVQKNFIIISW